MVVVYAHQEPPESYTKSLFLAGPTPRAGASENVPSWRPEALRFLEELGYDGVVFVPEDEDGVWKDDYEGQVEWEERCLHLADCILFWVPREMKYVPALTTNTEWGVWQNSGKVVFGAPEHAKRVRYQKYYANKLGVPCAESLKETIQNALEFLGPGSLRVMGEREVPLHIWRTIHFHEWYLAQKHAGNRLDGARVEWIFKMGPGKKHVFYWALHVDVYVTSEDRHKTNEVVLSRPDIATMVLYRRGGSHLDTDVVLIREFRSAARTVDGFVRESPGGSSVVPKGDQLLVAVEECREEVGLEIHPSRVQRHETRQLMATMSTHKAHLFSVELTEEELNLLKKWKGVARGVEGESERTYVEIHTLRDILQQEDVDWSALGMILAVLCRA